ncbi:MULTISPECIES: helix-turn-helix domain-containing protein [Natrialba]|uniref:Helix-turn-helix transcriptional regulator n=1 Tax=Natrialba swarupiae TaxID=2448032 RepID=A0A5D5AUC5_9EURY|nr:MULTISPECIES: helix-turn-helix domain-containing protein [Natrialba]MWV39328.1 helix-turn-helix domain-containing protein [Natrialba sp. INN-245]TYT63442.1 helix-turn-helix transcriptional regulator [Natrialba swarupiae]
MPRSKRTDSDPAGVLSALGNKYSAEILCAAGTPKSAQALSEDIEIPIATCYRRIEELVDAGLLTCEGRKLSEEGRRTNIYRRTVDELEVDFSGDQPEFSRKRRTEAKNQLQDQLGD